MLRNLPFHPQAGLPQSRQGLVSANKDVQHNLRKLEVLKPRITKRYERYAELIQAREARRESVELVGEAGQNGKNVRSTRSDLNKSLPTEPAIGYDPKTIAAGENKDLAVKLAHNEFRRRATERRSTRQAGISPKEEQGRRTAGMWNDWEQALTGMDKATEEDSLSKQLQKVRLQIDGSADPRKNAPFVDAETGSMYRYPPISAKHSHIDWHNNDKNSSEELTYRSHDNDLVPQRPSKFPHVRDRIEVAPKIPRKESMDRDEPVSESGPLLSPTTPERPKSPAYTFEPSAYLENGTPLRTIFLPPSLRHRFLDIALSNTRANLETCGILCGTLISNALFISKLVIPDQESTSDTCEMTNESDLFDFVDGEDLMVLGWIHTHPTQTCFMSSRDLHTHCGYQVMMPESIAIVCAPGKGE